MHIQEAADAKEAEGAFRSEIKEAKGNKSYDIIEVYYTVFLSPFSHSCFDLYESVQMITFDIINVMMN